jgi:predicted ATPase/Tfp pilus assembly protein PilF
MTPEVEPDGKIEIAHVLNMDVVAYSTLLITEQTRVMSELTRIVKETAGFRLAETEGKLACVPAGDGMALVFFDDPQAPVQTAIEIATALKAHPEIRLRMGIHSGPVNRVVDVSDHSNVVGAGIDIAQRVMDCGDAGHILLSKRVGEDLAPFPRWNPHLHDIGECEVKHGRRISLINFYTDEVGNPEMPWKIRQIKAQPAKVQRNNLPAQLSSFIGRESEMTEIKQLLANTRLLTLTGAGGCGKTRLALQVAADLLSDYPGGVWLVELAAASDPNMVIHLTAEALGIREQPKRSLLETLLDRLRSKHLLLVLDNCEHLLDACAKLADTLLKTCSKLQILATSREVIAAAGESVWQVPSLATPERTPTMSPEQLGQFEAVQLFRDRAVAVQPKFALTRATAPAVAQICWRLQGMPLAIELAAARMSALSVTQIAERLQDSFRLLSHGKRTAIPRHQTLQATIDWSYALLTEPERNLFRRLSVFAGGFDLKAAENVCAGEGIEREQVLDLLTQVVEKSLVLIGDQEGTTRYRLLEPIRQYAHHRLDQIGALRAARSRHLCYFLHVAQEGDSRMLGPQQRMASEELEAEHANLLAALAWAAEHDPESALKLSNALGWFWEFRGYLAQGREWFKRTIARSRLILADLRGEAYVRAGRLACWQGEYEDAVSLTEQGLRLCEESGNRRWVGMALNNLGGVAAYRGELDRAETLLERSLSVGKELNDNDLMWRSLQDLGVVAMYRGDYERARDLVEEAVAGCNQLGDKYGMDLHTLGEIELALGNIDKAAMCYEQALATGRKLGHKRAVVGGLDGLGKAAFDRGEYAPARASYEQALQVADELGQKSEFAIALGNNLAELAAEERKFDEARRFCTSSLRNSREVGDKESIVAALSTFAWLCFASIGQAEMAAQLFGAVGAIRDSLGMALPPRQRARYEHRIAAIRDALGQRVFAAAWARGKVMSIDQAVAYCLSI